MIVFVVETKGRYGIWTTCLSGSIATFYGVHVGKVRKVSYGEGGDSWGGGQGYLRSYCCWSE